MGGRVFNNQQFKDHMNSNYYPLDNMKKSVATLKASNQIDIETLEYGEYQQILSPPHTWPGGGGRVWLREMGRARIDLTAQANTTPLSNDEPTVIPLTRCALLDAALRKCFNSQPDPIPMLIDVMEKRANEPSPDRHDIRLAWDYGKDSKPTLLRWTMVCPFVPHP